MEGNKNKRRMIWCFVQVAVCVLILLTESPLSPQQSWGEQSEQ